MIEDFIIEGDLLQCDKCGRRIRVTSTWIRDVRSTCERSTRLRYLLTSEWPPGTAPLALLAKLKCKICMNSGASIAPRNQDTSKEHKKEPTHNELPFQDLYNISHEEFEALAADNFSKLSPTQVITIYNQVNNISASPEHLKILEEAYTRARCSLKPPGGYAFVEYSNTDGQ